MKLLKEVGFKNIKSIFSKEEAGISGKGVYFVSVK
jgi:hypothetical protein